MDQPDHLDLAYKRYIESSKFADIAYTRYGYVTSLLIVLAGANYALLTSYVNLADGLRVSEHLTIASSLLGFFAAFASGTSVALSALPKLHEEVAGTKGYLQWMQDFENQVPGKDPSKEESLNRMADTLIRQLANAEEINQAATRKRRDHFNNCLRPLMAATILLAAQAACTLPGQLWKVDSNERTTQEPAADASSKRDG